MSGESRRRSIIELLKKGSSPISATRLAEEFSVTRQIIVADIALLRASGHSISADNKGYTLEDGDNYDGLIKRIVVKHTKESVSEEFYTVVDNGGRVLDVIVEHSVYGKISASLNITSRYEADKFTEKLSDTGAAPLSLLTEGLHIHTIAVKDEESFIRIIEGMNALGILIEAD